MTPASTGAPDAARRPSWTAPWRTIRSTPTSSGFIRCTRKVYEEWNTNEGTTIVFMQVNMGGSGSVSDEDAVRIFSADQNGHFLAAAKVAFVLD